MFVFVATKNGKPPNSPSKGQHEAWGPKDKLASKWNNPDSNAVIVDVDCTTDDAKDLCNKYGVQGYPTLKYFSPTTSKDGDVYEDARDLKARSFGGKKVYAPWTS